MAQTLGSVIQEWLRTNGFEEKVQESTVPEYWEEIVGESVAKNAIVERIDRGRMFVRVDNATWRNEVVLRREEIRAKINARFGAEVIKEMIIR